MSATDPFQPLINSQESINYAYFGVLDRTGYNYFLRCQTTDEVVPPDYSYSQYAKYHERHCRGDFDNICVETNVALEIETIQMLVAKGKAQHVKGFDVTAVRIDEHRSNWERRPVIEVVSGSYSWTDSGAAWSGVEEVSIFVWEDSSWQYLETVEMMYDPF